MAKLTRRTAVRFGVSIVAATALRLESGGLAAARSEHESVLNGVIRRIPSGDAIVLETPGGLQRVRFLPHATFNRSGPASLTDFSEGDRVVVELDRDSRAPASARAGGAEQDDDGHQRHQHIAKHLEIRYGRLAGSVIAVANGGVTTTAGRVAVDADTVVHDAGDFTRQRPLSDLREGMVVLILTQFEPSSDTYLARRIGITSA